MKNLFPFLSILLLCALSLVIFLGTKNLFSPSEPSFPISEKEKYIDKAKKFLDKEKPDSAISLLSFALKENPDDFLAHFHLALAYYKKGDLSLSEYECQKAFELNPESQKPKNLLCDVRFEKGEKRWMENKKRKALSDFLFVLKNSDKKEKIEEITNLTAGRFKIERKTFDLVADYAPKFSPDGKKITFDAGFDKRKIYLMDLNGENLKCLSHLKNEDFPPSFPPDGRKIVFVSKRDGPGELYIMNSDGTKQKRLTYDGMVKKYLSFSPDGKTVAYVAKPKDQKDQYFEIYFLRLNQVISKEELIQRIENLKNASHILEMVL